MIAGWATKTTATQRQYVLLHLTRIDAYSEQEKYIYRHQQCRTISMNVLVGKYKLDSLKTVGNTLDYLF
jgi:hypothetical protein